MKIAVRPECAADYEVVSDLLQAAFQSGDDASFVAELRRSGKNFDPAMSLVAESDDGIVVGYMLLFPLSHSHRKILALHPIAIIPELQRKGIGQAMIKEGLRVAEIRGYGGVVVMGPAAYYRKFGFRPANEWGLFPDFSAFDSAFLAYEFGACGLCAGLVKYPSEFRAFDRFEYMDAPEWE